MSQVGSNRRSNSNSAMADHERVHPVMMEEGASSLTVPRSSFISEKHDGAHSQVPLARPIVPPAPETPKNPYSCCKCLCYTVGLLIFLLIVVGAAAGILYLVFQPKLPRYSVNNLSISDLTLNFNMTLYARFNVEIMADNPNKKIGIYYEKGSHLSVWYENTNLCHGSLPRFYQGHQNRTVLNVALAGQNQYGRALLEALQDQQQTGRIPLDLKINVPVSIKVGKLKLRKVTVLGTCKLIVDSLSSNGFINIQASDCNFGLKL